MRFLLFFLAFAIIDFQFYVNSAKISDSIKFSLQPNDKHSLDYQLDEPQTDENSNVTESTQSQVNNHINILVEFRCFIPFIYFCLSQ